jgi:hypothetical protein
MTKISSTEILEGFLLYNIQSLVTNSTKLHTELTEMGLLILQFTNEFISDLLNSVIPGGRLQKRHRGRRRPHPQRRHGAGPDVRPGRALESRRHPVDAHLGSGALANGRSRMQRGDFDAETSFRNAQNQRKSRRASHMTASDLEEVAHSAAGAPEVQSAGARPQGQRKQALAVGWEFAADSSVIVAKDYCADFTQVASIRVDLHNYFFTT